MVEMLQRGAEFAMKNSVQAAGFLRFVAELLARLRILGDRGERSFSFVRESDHVKGYSQEKMRVCRTRASNFFDDIDDGVRQIPVSAGAIFSRAVVDLIAFTIKVGISCFPMEWIDQNDVGLTVSEKDPSHSTVEMPWNDFTRPPSKKKKSHECHGSVMSMFSKPKFSR